PREPFLAGSLPHMALHIEKPRERDPAPGIAQQRQHAFAVDRVEPEHGIGPAQGLFYGAVANLPAPAGAYGRRGRFGDDVRNAERQAHRGAQPIRRLVIEVIGEPPLGSGTWFLPPSAQQPLGGAPRDPAEAGLANGIARPVITAQ